MNVRVFLLVLFTIAFMGVWDADRPATSLAKAEKQETPVAALPSIPAHSEHVAPAEILESSAAPAQETVPLDVQTILLLTTSVPWESSFHTEVPKPAELSVEQTKSGVIERAVDVITNLMADALMVQPVTSEEAATGEDMGVIVTEIEETPASVESAQQTEELSAVSNSETKSESATFSREAAEAFIPLPKNLAAGTWQVMTESGEFYRVTIDKSVAESATMEDGTEAKEEESFSAITTANGVRWCFIRAFASPQMLGSDRQASTEFFGPSTK